jgi:hypothetical protein
MTQGEDLELQRCARAQGYSHGSVNQHQDRQHRQKPIRHGKQHQSLQRIRSFQQAHVDFVEVDFPTATRRLRLRFDGQSMTTHSVRCAYFGRLILRCP